MVSRHFSTMRSVSFFSFSFVPPQYLMLHGLTKPVKMTAKLFAFLERKNRKNTDSGKSLFLDFHHDTSGGVSN